LFPITHPSPQTNYYLLTAASIAWWGINIYTWLVVIRVLISWFNPNQRTPFMSFLRKLVDPALKATRSVFPLTLGGMDFSPIVLILFLHFVANFARLSLIHLGHHLPASQLAPIFVLCLLELITSFFWFIWFMAIIRAIMSLVDPSPYNPLVMLVYGLTEPILAPLRGLLPNGPGGLDLRAVATAVALFLLNYYVLTKLKLMTIAWYSASSPMGTLF
jgi:YggT family protein